MSAQENPRLHGAKSSNRNGYSFTCPECNAKFNRLAHLRRHQMTHGGEKPYNCLYCPVASSRKDVIVRHTRNFHPGVVNKSSPGRRGKRRHNSFPGAVVSNTRANSALRAASTSATGGNDRDSEGLNDGTMDVDESPASNERDGSDTSPENLLDHLLPSHTDMFPPYLQDNPLTFSNGFVEGELIHSSFADIIDLDLLLSNAQGFLDGMPNSHVGQLPVLTLEPPKSRVSDLLYTKDTSSRNLALKDDACASARENFTKYPAHMFTSLKLPSMYAMKRFVTAFFEHVAEHIPIVHQPTFDISTVPTPLLLATMACGAAYLSERSAATSMHTIATQLVAEHERNNVSWKVDSGTKTWMLQTYLLLTYFGVHCGIEGQATHTFPKCIKRAQEALGELQAYQLAAYGDWVDQETINRCIGATILLGATLISKEKESCIGFPVFDAKFALPSTNAEWLGDEVDWEAPMGVLYSDDALKNVFAGEMPDLPVSEFGLVAIVAATLYRVCSFETLTSSHHSELYADFGEKMGRSVQVLDEILKHRMGEPIPGMAPDAIMQCAKSLLNSVYYHLYGSIPLANMKKLLICPAPISGLEDIQKPSDEATSPLLYKALIRAADQLRFDCRIGLKYLSKMGPIQFGPEAAVSSYEGGLLLCWYLLFAHSKPSLAQAESCRILSALIDEGFEELQDLCQEVQDQRAAVPLAVCVELLSDGSFWKWPCALSKKFAYLIKRLKTLD